MRDDIYLEPAAAYARGRLLETRGPAALDWSAAEALDAGRAAGLKLHRFKRTMGLPRVKAVLGALHGLTPSSVVDIGPGRGVFLWPLLDAFPALPVTVVERDPRRLEHLRAVAAGGLTRLSVVDADASAAPFDDDAFDVATVLEVLEHQHDPRPLAEAVCRIARRFVIASAPSKPDDNPEHVQLFTADTLSALLRDAGAARVSTSFVLNHIIAVARLS